jgi:hypothetical protein
MRQLVQENAPGDTSIRILASDGSSYTTLALLEAAGKIPFPGLDPGMNLGKLSVRSIATGGTSDGSAFYYLISQTQPSSTANMKYVSGGGQERQMGSDKSLGNELLMLWQLWFAMSVGTDIFESAFEY